MATATGVEKYIKVREDYEIDKLFRALVKLSGSDLHLKAERHDCARLQLAERRKPEHSFALVGRNREVVLHACNRNDFKVGGKLGAKHEISRRLGPVVRQTDFEQGRIRDADNTF